MFCRILIAPVLFLAVLPCGGAGKSAHWAFQPIQRSKPPAVRNGGWVRNEIDRFVLARLESEKLAASREASKSTLLRRISLDLIGLPPTPEELHDFLADRHADAYERVVDRLLASPHFGEKWARHWLDLARYADSDGYTQDLVRRYAWRYRHWVIDAFNQDKPFDEFTIEQIAGDLLPNATTEQKVATGFHRNTLTNREGGVDLKQFRFEQVVDRTSTVGTVWLGLTVGCAQCHDHKYDPITQKEFYQLFAFFDNADEVNVEAALSGELGPYLRTRSEYRKRRNELLDCYQAVELQRDWEMRLHEASLHPGRWTDWDLAYDVLDLLLDNGKKILAIDPAKRTEKEADGLTDHFVANYQFAVGKKRYEELKFGELKKKLEELEQRFPPLTQAQTLAENPQPKTTHLRVRGDYRAEGMPVQPGTPAVLPPLPAGVKPSRLALARWLVSPENPLTARVIVNRIWQELFGRGIVLSSEDFGTQGERPSHPELLDWLASEFMNRGWSMKEMIRLIVISSSYRQDSAVRPEIENRDPDNVLLARQSRLRLPAELIRDSALAVSGLLYPAIGGNSVRPPQPAGVAELGYSNQIKWPESQGADRYRRGLYILFQRTTPYPQLVNFDAPNAVLPKCRRERSNTPLQALNLLNDPVFFEAAQGLAARVLREAPAAFSDRLQYAYELCLARKTKTGEAQRLESHFAQLKQMISSDAKLSEALFPAALESIDRREAAAWVGLSRVLLNLDEFIIRE